MRRKAPWLSGVIALVCVVLAWAPDDVLALLAFDRQAIFNGELWRLWTAHVVHFSLQHALVNALVYFLVSTVAQQAYGARHVGVALALGAPVISLALLLVAPALLHYRGASAVGTMIALWAGASLWATSPSSKTVLALLFFIFVAKIAADASGADVELSGLPAQVRVAWQAHVLGAMAGGLIVFYRRIQGPARAPHRS